MALAVRAAQTGGRERRSSCSSLTMLLGLMFLVIKAFEYTDKFEHHHVPGPASSSKGPQGESGEIFFSLYFADDRPARAAHGDRLRYADRHRPGWRKGPVLARVGHAGGMAGLYWHFVDIVWIFLFPLLYLVDRAHQSGRRMSAHVLPKSIYYGIFSALMVLTAATVGVAFVNLGALNFPVAHRHRYHQGDARRPVFMHVKDSSRLTKMVVGVAVLFPAAPCSV